MTSPIFDPWLKSPFTDFGDLFSEQYFGRCADLELKAIDCMEAYGVNRGLKKCDDLLKDLRECVHKDKQYERITAMRNERQRQWREGERSNKDQYAPGPKDDSY